MSLMYPPSDFGIEELEIENSERMTRAELLTYKRKIVKIVNLQMKKIIKMK